jgi:hypothetical protein
MITSRTVKYFGGGRTMEALSEIPRQLRRLWQFETGDGYTFRCDLERRGFGWLAWFTVNGTPIGVHPFDAQQPAAEWADALLRQCERAKA